MARASSRIAPPSGLRVNRQSTVPVHVQLQTQIRHVISTGGLKPGMQLPTVRQLAGFLRINRNTIAKAFDGSLTTFFDGPTANGNWAGLDMGSAKSVSQISYAPRSGWASRMVGGPWRHIGIQSRGLSGR